ncbi:MAG: porin family protein [Hymenobacter sp.]
MKKSAFLVAALITTAAASSAQAQDVRFGLRAGANYSNLAGNIKNQDTYNNKVGFLGGVMINVPVTSDGFFSVQPEVLYSQKGFENKPTEYTGLGNYKQKREGQVNFNYLDVPVLLKINAGGFIAEAGPQYSYLISANDQTRTTTTPTLGGSPTTTDSQNKRDVSGLNRNELGYVAGVGYQATNGLSLNLRYNGAFSDFVKSDNSTYFNGDLKNARHSAFQLSLGYLISNK